ncbi:MAG: hypothetical protein LBU76_00155 [Azoarcus sp.]|nr:hypothetical protein [Azoarcus sp.]
MGISIYYTAERSYPLTDEENKLIEAIVKKYDEGKKFKKGEDFCVYEYDSEEPEVIFNGSTGLPMSFNPMNTVKACLYWVDCLTEIRNIVKDANWSVNMDDTELEWDEEEGWQLPME